MISGQQSVGYIFFTAAKVSVLYSPKVCFSSLLEETGLSRPSIEQQLLLNLDNLSYFRLECQSL